VREFTVEIASSDGGLMGWGKYMLTFDFFNRDPCTVAQALLGKIIRRRVQQHWLSAQIIETEAYYLTDKASHASLGYTEKRKALFMPAGTIYMYYARGRDSLNVSVAGAGNAVLIKSAFPYTDALSPGETIQWMQQQYPTPRPIERLCAGQTLLCQALQLKVTDWDAQQFDSTQFFIEEVALPGVEMIQTTRLGIPLHRDADLPYRFVYEKFAAYTTKNPLAKRK
jgi:DNA-3-methyladenine glycosylase